MDDEYNPKNISFRLDEVERGDFHIGQSYDDEPAKTIICSVCGSDKFIVGHGSYFTAVKCPICGYEIGIHSG